MVIPDSVLWYLPFEALPVTTGDAAQPLASLLSVRYAPTLSLAFPDGRIPRRVSRTALVAGKLFPREVDSLTEAAAEQMAAIDDTTLLAAPLTGPSAALTAACDRFVLMADVEDPEKLPYAWSPMQLDAGKPGSTLAEWGLLPFSGPEQFVFPGFHTPAEYGLKKGGSGDEVFLTVCGLMASGSRTILLSRWRVGGQSTVELMREFVQELPHTSAAAAWRRSVQLAAEHVLDPASEPRLKVTRAADGMKADHPFFWSGYLLVDTGARPPAKLPRSQPQRWQRRNGSDSTQESNADVNRKATHVRSGLSAVAVSPQAATTKSLRLGRAPRARTAWRSCRCRCPAATSAATEPRRRGRAPSPGSQTGSRSDRSSSR